MEDYITIIILIIMFGLPTLYAIFVGILELFKNFNKELKEAKLIKNNQNKFKQEQQEILNKQQENENKLLQIQRFNIQLKNEINKIIDNSQTSPWLANRIADYFEMLDTKEEMYLIHKKKPAITASKLVSEIKKEKRELLKKNKLLQYQLDYLVSNFPWLEDTMQLSVLDVKEALEYNNQNQDIKEDYEIIRNYISPEEYQKLSDIEKYQLALDRYLNKKKSNFQIGIAYERYIGYIYENKNYKVLYNGALEGLNDLGRDIIAENNKEILIIQCKNWSKEKLIRENVIFQLYGTMILKQLETKKQVKGILVTTTKLSDTAKKIGNFLNIQFRENEIFDKFYPCIKCNINKTTKEKIYHLPFDQQYDRIQIDINSGEKYVSTVKEAENLGFRRAQKHLYNTEVI